MIALFHFSVTQVRRGAGQSVIASAAYRAGEKLYSEYYGETNDYTRKGGVIHTEILLTPHAPDKYSDRATLWNAVEKSEKHPKAQLAYSFDIALQTELTIEENIALAREFVQTNFIAKGMIADLAVHAPDRPAGSSTSETPNHPEQPDAHSDTRQSNPHFHVLTTMRPLNADGTFAAKQHIPSQRTSSCPARNIRKPRSNRHKASSSPCSKGPAPAGVLTLKKRQLSKGLPLAPCVWLSSC